MTACTMCIGHISTHTKCNETIQFNVVSALNSESLKNRGCTICEPARHARQAFEALRLA